MFRCEMGCFGEKYQYKYSALRRELFREEKTS